MKRSLDIRELGRFVIVGGSAVFIDFLVYFALLRFAPALSTSACKAASFIAGAVVAFVFNRAFVFRSTGSHVRQVPMFAMLYLCSLAANNLVNALVLGLGAARLVAWFLATGTSTITNFVGMKFVVFAKGR